MKNSMDSMGKVAGGTNITITTNGSYPPSETSAYQFKGVQGRYQIQVLPQTMPQQRLPHKAHIPAASLYNYQITIPQIPQSQSLTIYLPPNVMVTPPSSSDYAISPMPVVSFQQKSAPASVSNWKKSPKPLHLRKLAQTKAATPQMLKRHRKERSDRRQPAMRQNAPVDWTRQPRPIHFRKPLIRRSVAKAPVEHKVFIDQDATKTQKVQQSPVVQTAPTAQVMPTVPTQQIVQTIQKAPTIQKVQIVVPPEPKPQQVDPVVTPKTSVSGETPVKRSSSSLEDVIHSKQRIVDRFNKERVQYKQTLAAHNRMVLKTIKAFASKNIELGNQLMLKTNESFGELNRANKKMMEVQREAFLASSDIDSIRTEHSDEPIPAAFLKFQQQVQAVSAMTANVNYYLTENLKIPITPDNGFQKAWGRLGAQLIKASKGLDD